MMTKIDEILSGKTQKRNVAIVLHGNVGSDDGGAGQFGVGQRAEVVQVFQTRHVERVDRVRQVAVQDG